ncbi:MAG: nickel-binding protein [Candidatus Limnocylindrales bacterium]|jgi:hypothetical protein
MPRYIGVHAVAFAEEQLQQLAPVLPSSVIWNSTYVAFADNKTYCIWEAPTKETMAEVFAKYEIPYDAIYEVRRFDPATNKLKPEPVAANVPQKNTAMEDHVLLDPGYRDLMRLHACVFRFESGTLPGFSVGDLIEIEGTDDAYTFSKPGKGRVATLPVASTKEERNISGWVSLRNRAAGVSVTLSPSDKLVTAWLAASTANKASTS